MNPTMSSLSSPGRIDGDLEGDACTRMLGQMGGDIRTIQPAGSTGDERLFEQHFFSSQLRIRAFSGGHDSSIETLRQSFSLSTLPDPCSAVILLGDDSLYLYISDIHSVSPSDLQNRRNAITWLSLQPNIRNRPVFIFDRETIPKHLILLLRPHPGSSSTYPQSIVDNEAAIVPRLVLGDLKQQWEREDREAKRRWRLEERQCQRRWALEDRQSEMRVKFEERTMEELCESEERNLKRKWEMEDQEMNFQPRGGNPGAMQPSEIKEWELKRQWKLEDLEIARAQSLQEQTIARQAELNERKEKRR
jgi:hypothetical protein